MKKMIITMVTALAFAGSAFAADVIEFKAKNGNVKFDHKAHQTAVGDCKKCHEGAPGKIAGFNKDHAHNKSCKPCHADMKKGPTKCGDCHKK